MFRLLLRIFPRFRGAPPPPPAPVVPTAAPRRPSEAEYQLAMAEATGLLAAWVQPQRRRIATYRDWRQPIGTYRLTGVN
jgi:hypothetical protein